MNINTCIDNYYDLEKLLWGYGLSQWNEYTHAMQQYIFTCLDEWDTCEEPVDIQRINDYIAYESFEVVASAMGVSADSLYRYLVELHNQHPDNWMYDDTEFCTILEKLDNSDY